MRGSFWNCIDETNMSVLLDACLENSVMRGEDMIYRSTYLFVKRFGVGSACGDVGIACSLVRPSGKL